MTDLTPNHPAVKAMIAPRMDVGCASDKAAARLNAALPHLTADDLPAHLVRDIQVRSIRAAARAATYDEGGIPRDHDWNLTTVSAWLDGLADNIEREGDA